MAEEKEPERKKLSLQGTKKLSLGSGPDLLKTNRNNSIPGMRSLQIETRRKRSVKGNFKPTGKTVGEPLQDWHIKNFKSHRIGEVELKNPGIYDISIHLKSRKKNIISWSWMWIKLDEN